MEEYTEIKESNIIIRVVVDGWLVVVTVIVEIFIKSIYYNEWMDWNGMGSNRIG